MSRSGRAGAALLALALAGAAAAYGAAIDGEFHLDDWTSIQSNFRLRSLDRALQIAPLDLLGPARPVTELTFALDYAAGGLAPSGYHLTSLLLHLATALLVFVLARGALSRADHPRAVALAAVVAGAFALHPLQTETVAYAAQRSEVLAALLGLGAVLALLAAEAAWPRPRGIALALGAAALLALAIGAKSVAVVCPVAFLLLGLVLPGASGATPPGRALARALAVAAPSLALSAASGARNLLVLRGPGQSAGLDAGGIGPWRYLLTQLRAHWLYVRRVAWPSGLSVDHGDFPPSPAAPDAATIAAGLALLAFVGVAVWLLRAGRRRELGWARAAGVGILWWILFLVPTSSFVPILDLVAEHRTYLASAGLLLAAAVTVDAALARAAPRRAAAAGLALALAAFVALGAALAARAQVWRSDRALWADAARKGPGSFRAASNLAWAEHAAGRTAAALEEYRRAERLAQTPADRAAVARNLSALHLDLEDAQGALAVADRGIAERPGDPELRNNRSIALFELGRLDDAIAEAERAVALAPGEPGFHDTLGLNLLAAGLVERAAEAFLTAYDIDPGDLRFAEKALVTLDRVGRREEACAIERQVRARHGAAVPPSYRVSAEALGCR